MTNKIWRISYSYKAGTVDGQHRIKESYTIVAGNEEEAILKSDNCFSYSDLNKELIENGTSRREGVELSDLRKNIRKYRETISYPKLTCDSEEFDIEARIGSDGKTLEFYAVKK